MLCRERSHEINAQISDTLCKYEIMEKSKRGDREKLNSPTEQVENDDQKGVGKIDSFDSSAEKVGYQSERDAQKNRKLDSFDSPTEQVEYQSERDDRKKIGKLDSPNEQDDWEKG
ncbi:11209_t:CDS:2 [Scutellospora calospora]|uniref:11209_t:CDS:1 n=1 Tax=Scutellospora calospora TaxID=85575 RepID=A0ACA9KKC2_9GLOM|nr:11209_t:CDS:2 [Scutellospora calospora]